MRSLSENDYFNIIYILIIFNVRVIYDWNKKKNVENLFVSLMYWQTLLSLTLISLSIRKGKTFLGISS